MSATACRVPEADLPGSRRTIPASEPIHRSFPAPARPSGPLRFPLNPRWLAWLALLACGPAAAATTLFVWPDSPNPTRPYRDWTTAAHTIQDAVDAAAAGDDILVTNGVYQTGAQAVYGMSNRVAVTKPLTLRSVNGPEVTVIEGYQVPGIPNGDAAVRCVYLTNGAVLAGFTLTNGAAQDSGGGVWCESSGAVVTNCVLTRNSAWRGGGAWSGTLNNCTLTSNGAECGGGAYLGTLNNCTLAGNYAVWGGGGAWGGTLNNCTLTGNRGSEGGGGAHVSTLNNCIVYYNTAWGVENYDWSTLNYCCTTPLPAGMGNFTTAPQFVDTNGWSNLRLQANSPCINAANNAYVSGGTDLHGNPRIVGGTVDIGAYELQTPTSQISYAWLQSSMACPRTVRRVSPTTTPTP